jgi:hypothetical protein
VCEFEGGINVLKGQLGIISNSLAGGRGFNTFFERQSMGCRRDTGKLQSRERGSEELKTKDLKDTLRTNRPRWR